MWIERQNTGGVKGIGMGKAQEKIVIKGLRQNNLKNISLEIPKEKIVVFTGTGNQGEDRFSENVQEFFGSYHALFSGFSGKAAGKERLIV